MNTRLIINKSKVYGKKFSYCGNTVQYYSEHVYENRWNNFMSLQFQNVCVQGDLKTYLGHLQC